MLQDHDFAHFLVITAGPDSIAHTGNFKSALSRDEFEWCVYGERSFMADTDLRRRDGCATLARYLNMISGLFDEHAHGPLRPTFEKSAREDGAFACDAADPEPTVITARLIRSFDFCNLRQDEPRPRSIVTLLSSQQR